MKTLRQIGLLVAMLMIAFFANSCSDDDDSKGNGSSGSTTVTIDGKPVSLSHVYWWAYDDEMHIEFYSFDITSGKFPGSMNLMSIDYDIPSTQSAIEDVTLESGLYHIYLAKNVTMENEGWQGETDSRDTSNSPLIIKKNGNKISVYIEQATVGTDYHADNVNLHVEYNGTIKKLPSEYWDY